MHTSPHPAWYMPGNSVAGDGEDPENAVTAFGELPINVSLTRRVCNQCHLGITGLMLQPLSYLVQVEFPLVLPVEEPSKDLTSIRMTDRNRNLSGNKLHVALNTILQTVPR